MAQPRQTAALEAPARQPTPDAMDVAVDLPSPAAAVGAAVLSRSTVVLPLRTVANLRDVGGFGARVQRGPVVTGPPPLQQVRRGCIYRSARPDHVSAEETQHLLGDLGLRTVLDLRSVAETKRVHDATDHLRRHFQPILVRMRRFGGVVYRASPVDPGLLDVAAADSSSSLSSGASVGAPVVSDDAPPMTAGAERAAFAALPAAPESRRLYQLDLAGSALMDSSPWWVQILAAVLCIIGLRRWAVRVVVRYGVNPRGLYGMYTALIDRCQPRIREALRIVANPNHYPMLIHCTQGKDRTGIIVALVLHILGVTEPEILADYAKSEEGLRPEWDRQLHEIGKVGLLEEFLRSPPSTLRETLTYIRSRYGSIDEYLDRIGFDHAAREGLRSVLLEGSVD